MEHIRVIQEVVDEHKDEMPTGVVTRVMAECQKAYEAAPKLYKLTWTVVDSHAHIEYCEDAADFAAVKLSHQPHRVSRGACIVFGGEQSSSQPTHTRTNTYKTPACRFT